MATNRKDSETQIMKLQDERLFYHDHLQTSHYFGIWLVQWHNEFIGIDNNLRY